MLNEFSKKEAPIQGVAGLGGGVPSRLLTLASGTTTYVDDVFSTFLYDGTGSAQTITNGIDLSGEGGLVWIKSRNNSYDHRLTDTERGLGKALESNTTDAEATTAHCVNGSFNSDGFSLSNTGTPSAVNTSGDSICSWTFRKCPGFFDIQTYTGNGTGGLNISHDLGSIPGFVIVKSTSLTEGWFCYHRSLGNTKMVALNGSGAAGTATQYWNDTSPTDTTFTVGTDTAVNANGQTYVAYLFAHNDGSFGEDSDEAVIKCGGYTGTGSTGLFVNLGFEPQFVILKRTDDASNWLILDHMRGVTFGSADDIILNANQQDNEANCKFNAMEFNPTGFTLSSAGGAVNGSGASYIYIAIRRPHKPPESATDVFDIDTKSASSANTPSYSANFPVDLAIRRNNITSSDSFEFCTRITNTLLYASSTDAEVDGGSIFLDFFAFNNGWATSPGADSNDYLWMLKRAPGFMDVVAYSGNSTSGRTVDHNLTVVPEMMIVRKRNGSGNWQVYHSSQGNTKYSPSFRTDPFYTSSGIWNNTSPTSTQFTLGNANDVNGSFSYIAYLFATLPGISKVGSYSGTGSAQNIDCGFTNGARFVLIKRADTETQGSAPSRTNWYVWDSTRGISSGNDPWLALNENDAQVTNTDYIDPLNAGFTVSSTGSGLNASGGTYIFLAIA